MANFKLNCQLNINGPANMRAITQQIQRQLSSINANVNFKINPSATRNVNNLNTAAGKLNVTLQALTRSANQAVPAINNLASALASNAGNIKTIAQSAQGLQKNLQAVQKTTQQVTNSMESLGKQAANAIKRYAAFSIAAGGTYSLRSKGNASLTYDAEHHTYVVGKAHYYFADESHFTHKGVYKYHWGDDSYFTWDTGQHTGTSYVEPGRPSDVAIDPQDRPVNADQIS